MGAQLHGCYIMCTVLTGKQLARLRNVESVVECGLTW